MDWLLIDNQAINFAHITEINFDAKGYDNKPCIYLLQDVEAGGDICFITLPSDAKDSIMEYLQHRQLFASTYMRAEK